ncbi:MAG: CBS domain-containing protein [Chloroflexi bacterium]|nr:CBS domain-containing protein [Chloroflexota bacterium]
MTTLILTHEQADFDAVASLWAAHRLHPSAIPVLPRRVNRNVRAFLNLYGDHFGFAETEDLPRQRVERVIVVDAQSASSVKGMSAKTEITVIDHHAGQPDSGTGANTTLLAEQLAESLTPLSPVEATLLLLGIYEDTGSLTYLTTTPRDARAAAHLLEAGAQLEAAREFLHHPLTGGQRALYDQLLAAAETHLVNGQAVTISAIDGGETDEELSTLAHKLRDTLDPAALFVLVNLRGHEPRVQLIARSTTANVDVGAMATHFGGGGHGRAAAALIRDRSLDDVRTALIAALPDHIRPVATVAQIMSHGVQTLSPDTTVRAAAERFKKHSYEGYPVVDAGRVVGLLTRRAVDRAIHHHLDTQPVSAIMDSGEVTVKPGDSLEHLQKLMTTHGWGQVPVVDADAGNVIGVVTRTDLLKRLATPVKPPRRNLADQLARALPAERLALLHLVSDEATALNVSPFIVGGFVRDLLLGQPGLDFDIVVEGEAIALAKRLAAKHGGRVTAHSQFGTAKWKLPPALSPAIPSGHLDLVSARTEFYAHPSALPEVERGSIKLDLHRRDFTLNTLAIRLAREAFGDLLDFWGGERDLRDGLIRVLHSLSFVDDATRILRAVRFEQRFGFRIEARTAELLAHALHLLHKVSGDRIRHELDLILQEAEPERHIARLAGLGILSHIHPELPADSDLPRRMKAVRECALPLKWSAWLLPLTPSVLNDVVSHLRLSAHNAEIVQQAAHAYLGIGGLPGGVRMSELNAWLGQIDRESLRLATSLCDQESLRRRLEDYLRRRESLKLATTGETLQALGLPPGPRYREILGRLQNAYLDDEITNAEEERALLGKILERQN